MLRPSLFIMNYLKVPHTHRLYLIALSLMLTVMSGCSALPFLVFDNQTISETALVGDIERGKSIFQVGINESPPCSSCHQSSTDSFSLGIAPSLIGISERASTRIEGMSAEEYIRKSILEPKSFIVGGFSIEMFSDYRDYFTEQDIADLIAFLMSL